MTQTPTKEKTIKINVGILLVRCPFSGAPCTKDTCRGCPTQTDAADRIAMLDEYQANIGSIDN